MVSLGTAFRAFSHPKGCATHSFHGGLLFVFMIIYVIIVIVVSVIICIGPSPLTVLPYLAGSGLVFISLLYQNYYYVEGCQAKRILTALNQRDRLTEMMKS